MDDFKKKPLFMRKKAEPPVEAEQEEQGVKCPECGCEFVPGEDYDEEQE